MHNKSDSVCNICKSNNQSLTSITKFRSAMQYNDIAKNIVVSYKNKANFRLHQWICQSISDVIRQMHCDIDCIVPVPTHWARHIMRGYPHTYMIAHEVSCILEIAYHDQILYKSRYTKSQSGLSKAQRSNNLSNSFNINNPNDIKGLNIMLIDDVKTTGATLNACADILLQYGAKTVYSATLAMT